MIAIMSFPNAVSVSICRTCPRDRRDSGVWGLALAQRLRQPLAARGIDLLMVNCLGACTHPCTLALDAPAKDRLRFSGLSADDETSLQQVVDAYSLSTLGRLDLQTLAPSLQMRLSAVSPKLGPAA